MSPVNQNDDFDPQQAFTKLSANLDQPDKFAEIFCKAAVSQKNIDQTLKDIVKSLLKHDSETRNEVKVLLKEIDGEHVQFIIKKVFSIGGAILLLVIGALLQAVSRHFLP